MHGRSAGFLSTSALLTGLLVILGPSTAVRAADGDVRTFGGLRFGAGLSLTVDTGDEDRIESAEVVNGVVRVTEERNVVPRLMLETHYFFPARERPFLGVKDPGTWAWGPFVGVQSSKDDVIDAFALGLMVGFRKTAPEVAQKAKSLKEARTAKRTEERNAKRTGRSVSGADAASATVNVETAKENLAAAADAGGASSFNIGLGAVVDPKVRVLGDGFEVNEPPPPNETEVRYKTTSQWGVVLMFSFSF